MHWSISQVSWHRQSRQDEGAHTFEPLQTLEQPHTDGKKTQVISQEFFWLQKAFMMKP